MARIVGTNSQDVKHGTAGADEIFLKGGNDSGSGEGGNDIVRGDDGNDTIFGDDGRDTLYGGAGRDSLYGGNGNDTLYGDDGFDQLSGGDGNDLINGGSGSDDLIGGKGADIIQYLNSTADNAPNGDQFVDFIYDFSRAEGDRIGVGGIDANPDRAGDQAFHFIGTHAFSGAGGEARYQRELDPAGDPQTRVQFDVDGDRAPDLTILLVNGYVNLTSSDFIL